MRSSQCADVTAVLAMVVVATDVAVAVAIDVAVAVAFRLIFDNCAFTTVECKAVQWAP